MATQIFFISLIAGLIVFGAEIFVPGGVLGVLGMILLMIAIGDAFIAFPEAGPYVALAIVFFIGLALYLWIKIFPSTRVGQRMTVSNSLATFTSADTSLKELVGKQGVAVSPLRPAGYAMVDGRRVDVMTRGEMIPKDAPVAVIAFEGSTLVVARQTDSAAGSDMKG